MPHTRDFSDALFRRARILTFNNKFEGENCDPLLKEKLIDELPGILNLALQAVASVFDCGEFTTPASMSAAVEEWRLEADQVRQFIQDRCQLAEGKTEKGRLFQSYELWASDVRVSKRLSHRSFTNRLRQLGVGEHRDGKSRYYTGVVLGTDEPTIDAQMPWE